MSKGKPQNPMQEPKKIGSYRVLRGGRWLNSPHYLESASRDYDSPSFRGNRFGFRVARTRK